MKTLGEELREIHAEQEKNELARKLFFDNLPNYLRSKAPDFTSVVFTENELSKCGTTVGKVSIWCTKNDIRFNVSPGRIVILFV